MENNHTSSSTDKSSIFKKWFLYILIGGLSITALITIGAVIIGEWNNAISRAIALSASGWIHSLLALVAIQKTPQSSNPYSNIPNYTFLGTIVSSFIITILNIFNIMPPNADTSGLYFWLLSTLVASTIVSSILTVAAKKDRATKAVANLSVGSLILLIFMSFFLNFGLQFDSIYYRLLLAVTILCSTSLILAIIFNRVYTVKHPELAAKKTIFNKKLSAGAIVLIILGSLIMIPLIFFFLASFTIRLL